MNWKNDIWIQRNNFENINETNESSVALSDNLGQNVLEDKTKHEQDLLANLVLNRNFDKYDLYLIDKNNFLDILHDPFLMQGMDKAAEIAYEACVNQRRVFIHGDYDADGLTSSSILYKFFTRLGLSKDNIKIFIPNRLEDGYGLSPKTLPEVYNFDAELLVTVDCGIKSVSEFAELKQAGIQCLLTDHHLPDEIIPETDAVIDPHILGDNYPMRDLAGAGVAYKLCQAIVQKYNLDESLLDDLAALAMIGTVADVMPLRNENRHIVNLGLQEIANGSLVAVREMAKEMKLNPEKLTAENFAFSICPRINAAGRMGQNDVALDLLLCEDLAESRILINNLEAINNERKNLQNSTVKEIDAYLEQHPELLNEPLILLKGENWHTGILGIISARIQENWQKSTIILGLDNSEISENNSRVFKGSGRSYAEFDLHRVMSKVDDYLYKFGGHKKACGLSVEEDKWDEFYKHAMQAAREELKQTQSDDNLANANKIIYDLEISPDAVNLVEAMSLEALEPLGEQNSKPVFLLNNLRVNSIRTIGKGKHLKLDFINNDQLLTGIAFNKGDLINVIKAGDEVSLLANLEINRWKDNVEVQLNISDLAFAEEAKYMIWENIKNIADNEKDIIETDDIIAFWNILTKLNPKGSSLISLKRIQNFTRIDKDKYLSLDNLKSIMEIFSEMGLLRVDAELSEDSFYLSIQNSTQRAKISDTNMAKNLIKKGVLVI